MYNNIVLAYDGSQASQEALLNCKDLSQWHQAQVHLLAVVPYDLVALGPETAYYNDEQNKAEHDRFLNVLNDGVAQLSQIGIKASGQLRRGDPVDQIVHYAQEISAELIILGHKHRDSWIERWWRGSISKALIEHSPCSVLVVILK
ncbi:universal stress protein [Limnohabitans sp. Hippo4]|uniref:universal stress protein n=1 Tax=Limnohabitans sp. Hippo4 TaxID=1826167 RepID=UPI000D37C416|nr:universal stress protein [Limnohabitans sp. Hippo4]PUE33250.1 universal stress protein [Limnohabitans sp. Hippo4]